MKPSHRLTLSSLLPVSITRPAAVEVDCILQYTALGPHMAHQDALYPPRALRYAEGTRFCNTRNWNFVTDGFICNGVPATAPIRDTSNI